MYGVPCKWYHMQIPRPYPKKKFHLAAKKTDNSKRAWWGYILKYRNYILSRVDIEYREVNNFREQPMWRVRRVLFRFPLNSIFWAVLKISEICNSSNVRWTRCWCDISSDTDHRALITRHAIQHSRPSYALQALKNFRGFGKYLVLRSGFVSNIDTCVFDLY